MPPPISAPAVVLSTTDHCGIFGQSHLPVQILQPAEAFQPPTIRQFLADNDLPLEYASMLADLGVVEISHCVDLTLEDLAGFMKPIEARRFIRIAAQWSTGKVEVL